MSTHTATSDFDRSFSRNRTIFKFIFGFALIIILSVWALVGFSVFTVVSIAKDSPVYLNAPNISIGINGIAEDRCIRGMVHVIGPDGSARQTVDEFGNGMRCS